MRKRYPRKATAWFVGALMISTLLVVTMPAAAKACGYQKWYLPEGYTGANFDTYILIQNPNDWDAEATVRFMTEKDVTEPVKYELGPNSRTTINVDEQPGLADANVSTMVESSSGVVVERAMYFNDPADGKVGGSDSIGAKETSRTWYLAEGYTGEGFDTYVLVMNPNELKAYVKVTYITPGASGGRASDNVDPAPEPKPAPKVEPTYLTKYYEVEPMRRFTIHVDEIAGLEDTDVSFKVESVASLPEGGNYDPQPDPKPEPKEPEGIVAERAMYFTYHGFLGGHASIGAPQASNTWYLPEGRTAGTYDTYVLVLNPNSCAAHIKATFMVPDESDSAKKAQCEPTPGPNPEPEPKPEPQTEPKTEPKVDPEPEPEPSKLITREYTIEPMQRFTIPVDEIQGLEATDVSTMIQSWAEESGGGSSARNECGAPVVVERAMYFAKGNSGDGHNSIGAYQKMEYWLMAEGYTGGGFDTWVLVQNPNETDVKIKATFMTPEGDPIVKEYKIGAMSRLTIPVDEIEGLESTEVSTKIQVLGAEECKRNAECENGVVAERAMYFEYKGIVGGHCSLGVGE